MDGHAPAGVVEGDGGDSPADGARIVALLAGDEDALSELRRWIRGAFMPYRTRLAPELDDVEQEVILAVLEALRAGRFEGRSLLSTYARRTVHHRCLNRLRARRGKQWVDPDDAGLADPDPSPFEQAQRRNDLDLALRVLAEMPESCRELWVMIHRGLDYATMAERIGVAAGTLRVRVLRCRERAVEARDRLARGNAEAIRGT
jgi:RNA polymerase sigma factor (sigma-70 family)